MHSSTSEFPTIELRILSGPQAGAALPLVSQDIVLGSAWECDAILQSPGISARHAALSLSVADNSFALTALDGDIAPAADVARAAPWQFGATIYLGDVGITVDHCAETWRSASPPRNATRDMPSVTGLGGLLSGLGRYRKRFLVPTILLAAMATIVTVAAASQMIHGKRSLAGAQGELSRSSVDAINKILERYRSDGQLTLEETSKNARVHGFLPNTGRVNALRNALSAWRPSLTFDVKAEDALLAASKHYLSRQRSALKVAIVDGQAALSGFEERREDVKRLAQDLQKNVPGLTSVEATFVDQPRLEAWLRTWRKEAPAPEPENEALHVATAQDGALTLTGTLSSSRIAQLRQELTQHSLRQNMLLAMRIAITAPDQRHSLPPTVRSFSLGAVPYVFLSNGRRLMIGGDFDGFQLVAIKGQGPVFEKKGG